MSYSKQQIIDLIFPAVLKSSTAAPEAIRSYLEQTTYAELNEMLEKQRKAGLIFQSVANEDVEKAQRDLEKILHDGEETEDKVLQINAERAAQRVAFQLEHQRQTEPQRTRDQSENVARARQVFEVVCRKHSVANIEANFRLLYDADLLSNEYTASQAIAANGVLLAPASQEEISKWRVEAVEERQDFLVNQATPEQLKYAARKEAVDSSAAAAQTEINRQLEAIRVKDAPLNYPALPIEFTKDKLLEILKNDTKRYRFFIQKFGNYNITVRLQGRG